MYVQPGLLDSDGGLLNPFDPKVNKTKQTNKYICLLLLSYYMVVCIFINSNYLKLFFHCFYHFIPHCIYLFLIFFPHTYWTQHIVTLMFLSQTNLQLIK